MLGRDSVSGTDFVLTNLRGVHHVLQGLRSLDDEGVPGVTQQVYGSGETELSTDGGVIRGGDTHDNGGVTIDRPYGDGSTGTITSNGGGRNVDVTGTRVVEGYLEDLTVLDLGSTRGGNTTGELRSREGNGGSRVTGTQGLEVDTVSQVLVLNDGEGRSRGRTYVGNDNFTRDELVDVVGQDDVVYTVGNVLGDVRGGVFECGGESYDTGGTGGLTDQASTSNDALGGTAQVTLDTEGTVGRLTGESVGDDVLGRNLTDSIGEVDLTTVDFVLLLEEDFNLSDEGTLQRWNYSTMKVWATGSPPPPLIRGGR